MRAASRGIYYDDAIVCGLPCSTWISLTEETFSFVMGGYVRNDWPDGKSTMDQEQCVVDILKICLSELARDLSDATKKRN